MAETARQVTSDRKFFVAWTVLVTAGVMTVAGVRLPAIEKILEQHGGGLEVQTKLGEGTSMIAWFPAGQSVKEAA